MAAVIGIDLAVPGTTRKVVEAALARVVPPAAAAPKPAPVGVGAAGFPLGPAAAITGSALTAAAAMDQAMRDRAATKYLEFPLPQFYNPLVGDMPTIEIPIKQKSVKKRLSKYNKAVKAGMSAVRASTSYGKKGTINNAKKAFAAVNKVASKVNRGKKVSTRGITGKIARAVRRKL